VYYGNNVEPARDTTTTKQKGLVTSSGRVIAECVIEDTIEEAHKRYTRPLRKLNGLSGNFIAKTWATGKQKSVSPKQI
jgi:phosphoribosylamine-glycine ligase